MKKVKENAFDIRRISKLMWNENVGIIFLMILSGICHKFRDIHPIFENGCVFLVFIGFLSLVIVEGMNLVSKWNKSSKRGFLTAGNIIGLVFLGVLLVGGIYAILTIFNAKDNLTIKSLGIFGIIWTLRWIQKLKNFSSTRDNVHKLIGPLIAIIILISGYAMHSKNTIFGPFSCVLAPAMMWFCSLIFGDIKGRSNDQDDEINPFAIILSIILLGLVIYAIRNPEMYGIEIPSVDGRTLKETYKSELKDYEAVSEEIGKIKAKINELETDKCRLLDEAILDAEEIDELETRMKYLKTEFPNVYDKLKTAEEKLGQMKAQLTTKKQKLMPHRAHIESLNREAEYLEREIQNKTSFVVNMPEWDDNSTILPQWRAILRNEITSMDKKYNDLKEKINAYKTANNLVAREEELQKIDNLIKAADRDVKSATPRYIEIRAEMGRIRDIELPQKEKDAKAIDLRLKKLGEELKQKQDALASLEKSQHLAKDARSRRERLKEFSDAYSELNRTKETAEQTRKSAADMCKANLGLLKTERRALLS